MIAIYKPDRETPARKGSRLFDLIELAPGRNRLSPAEITTLKAHPDYPRFEEWGAIEIAEADKDGTAIEP
ncbi:MAG: hypothetical protein N5P05_004594 [Chroococcopsis gigantea SAG 12.99]|nr:hypothetical protein [Chroococcopsis gigantea SAG 12.99]